MAKERLFDLPETKGEFKLRGLVQGTAKDDFFKSKITKTKKPMNLLKFGVQTDEDNLVKVSLNGMARDEAFFYKKAEEKGKKGVTKRIPWANRLSFNESGFNLIGIKVGVKKTLDENGIEKNDTKTYTEYDACKELGNSLADGLGVFVRGNLEFSSFTNTKDNGEVEIKRSTKFVPNQISAVTKPIDFNEADFVPTSDFQQTIIIMEVTKDQEDDKGIVSAKIVTYNTIEDAEFVVRNRKLFKNLKGLKPYTAIKVWGNIVNKAIAEEVVEDDGWGESNSFEATNTYIKELEITGADKDSIDKDTYCQSNMDEALEKIRNNEKANNDFGSTTNDDWGVNPSGNSTDEEDEGWD
ncbi:hypothetical protein [Clostridium paraputrificum]|uniref:hypothetical protein n=1 Tax=Clostridium paraputrificum TaxID=29363 RepID=UPI0018A0975A|nr:hypothetical protein [Clostridium paraputrificum]